jgi:hypothetical protein
MCVSADFSRPETVADSEFYRVIPVERADMIVIDSIYYTDGSRPVLFYKAEELIRFAPLVVLDDAWRYRHCVARATQRNPGSSEASAWDQARLSGRTSSPTEAASRVAFGAKSVVCA